MRNIWNHSYPMSMLDAINRATNSAEQLRQKLNEPECPSLGDLYIEKNNGVHRNKNVFAMHDYCPLNDELELKGLYVFGEELNGEIVPVYVGISRTVFRRLRQHGWGKAHNQCTLAYLIANHKYHNSKWSKGRINLPIDQLDEAKSEVQSFKVAILQVEEDFDLYHLEVTLAGIFKTKWNSFRTH